MLGNAHGNGKSDAHTATRFGINGGVDAQQIALHIHQGAARIARVDGCVGLYEVFKGVDAQLVAPQCRHDATGNSLPHTKRVAYGQNNIANLKLLGAVHHHHGQFFKTDFEHSQIGFRVGANHFGLRTPAIVEHHQNFICTFNHVVVGENVALRADDDATA